MAVTVTKEGDVFRFSGRAFDITKAKNEALEPYGCRVHNYGLVLELIPDDSQRAGFAQQIGNARFMRNQYLNDRIAYYKETRKTLPVDVYKKKYFPKLKEQYSFLTLSDKFALESAIEHVDTAYKNFFEGRAAFPKFASKWKPSGNTYTTKWTGNNIRLEEHDGLPYIKLPKVGLVRFILPKKQTIQTLVLHGTSILSVAVKKKGDRYTASLQSETVVESPVQLNQMSVRDIMAADMGIKLFAIIGGEDWEKEIPNPRWIRIHEKRLRRRIVDRCSVFCCEDLNIRGMVKNRRLAKEISSASWGQFLTMVKYKMERQGKHFIQVSRWFPSSQTCSRCGFQNTVVKDLVIRSWKCPKCGTYHNRDVNAKNNILAEGIRLLQKNGIIVTV